MTGVRRNRAAASALRASGIEPLALDLSDWHAMSRLPSDTEAIVACQSALGESEDAYRLAYLESNRNLLEAAGRLSVRAIVYTSSTGVFGQRDGSTVDEKTPVHPAGPSAEILAEAERLLIDAASRGLPARVVRLSGLYGPARDGVVERVRSGVLGTGPGDDTWMNWCHRDDAVSAIVAAIDRGRSGAIYHATDAEPARRREVVEWIAGRLGIAPAKLDGDHARSSGGRRGAHRRIVGDWTRAELGLELAYPSFRDGLAPLIQRGA